MRIESASTSFNGSSCVWKWPRPSVLSINDAEPLATTKNRQTNSIKVHLMRHFEIKSALLVFKSAPWNFKKMTSSKIRYFTGACTFREHICIVRHGGQPFWYNLGAGVDVRGQTHVPARHFSLQSAYQSAGPGHSVVCRPLLPPNHLLPIRSYFLIFSRWDVLNLHREGLLPGKQ